MPARISFGHPDSVKARRNMVIEVCPGHRTIFDVFRIQNREITRVAIGLIHPTLGQTILLLVTPSIDSKGDSDFEGDIAAHCRREMPNFMVPQKIICTERLPHNQNGKIDRKRLAEEYRLLFSNTQPDNKSNREQNT